MAKGRPRKGRSEAASGRVLEVGEGDAEIYDLGDSVPLDTRDVDCPEVGETVAPGKDCGSSGEAMSGLRASLRFSLIAEVDHGADTDTALVDLMGGVLVPGMDAIT
ncbi:hypothetical protein Dimus_016516 [Dionaea muscipula]